MVKTKQKILSVKLKLGLVQEAIRELEEIEESEVVIYGERSV